MDFDEMGHTTDTQNSHRWQFVELPEFNVALSTRNVMSIFCQVLFNFRNLHYLRNHFAGHWIYKLMVARIHRLDRWMASVRFGRKLNQDWCCDSESNAALSNSPALYTVLAHNQAHSCIPPANTSVRWYYSIISWLVEQIGRWNNGIGTYANDTNWVIRGQVSGKIWTGRIKNDYILVGVGIF